MCQSENMFHKSNARSKLNFIIDLCILNATVHFIIKVLFFIKSLFHNTKTKKFIGHLGLVEDDI